MRVCEAASAHWWRISPSHRLPLLVAPDRRLPPVMLLPGLLAARQGLHDTNRRLTVLNPSRAVHRVFELSGLIEVLDVRPDDGAAAD